MKHLKLFESFGLSIDLTIEDVKDLLQDVIDDFNLRKLACFKMLLMTLIYAN